MNNEPAFVCVPILGASVVKFGQGFVLVGVRGGAERRTHAPSQPFLRAWNELPGESKSVFSCPLCMCVCMCLFVCFLLEVYFKTAINHFWLSREGEQINPLNGLPFIYYLFRCVYSGSRL